MNRCIGYNKNNHKCRAKTKNNQLFCCKQHEPINNDLVDTGCFICMDKITSANEMIYFKCSHVFHKSCYFEWLNFSTYETPICMFIDV